MKKLNILITGGTGLLGKQVVKRLLKNDNELYLLSRHPINDPLYNYSSIHIVNGSLESIPEWEHNLRGIDIVIHMAAPVVFWGEWSMYQKLVVDATQSLLDYSEQNNVKRFIYISSESVLQDKKDLMNIDETEPYPKEPNSFYGKSKMLAEKNILSTSSSMTRVILRPTFIWGNNVAGLNLMADKIKNGQFMWINEGKPLMEMVHVENVAYAIELATLKGDDKDIFFVTDDSPKTAKEFLTDMMNAKRISIPKKSMPKSIAQPLASLVETVWKFLRIKKAPPLTRFDLSFIALSRKYNIQSIKTKLGYEPVITYEEGLKQIVS